MGKDSIVDPNNPPNWRILSKDETQTLAQLLGPYHTDTLAMVIENVLSLYTLQKLWNVVAYSLVHNTQAGSDYLSVAKTFAYYLWENRTFTNYIRDSYASLMDTTLPTDWLRELLPDVANPDNPTLFKVDSPYLPTPIMLTIENRFNGN